MLDKRSSLCGIVILVSLFFVPNFAFANGWGYTWYDMVIFSPILYPFSFLSIAVVYVVIKLLKSFKPSLGNYIHSSRLLKIGLYSSAWVHSWVIYHIIIPAFLNKSIRFNDEMFYDFLFRLVIPGIIIISIVIIKHFVLKKVPTAIVVTVVVSLIFVSIFIIYQTQNPGMPTRTLIEFLAVIGYDARDLSELKTHDGITMLKNSAGIQNNAKEKDERVVIYLLNTGDIISNISEVRFGGTVYNFQGNVKVIDNYDGTAPSQGNYVILTDGASGLLRSSGEIQPGQTITVVLDLADQLEDGSGYQIKVTTSNGGVFVGMITIGQEASQVSGTPRIESVKILGYDARDVAKLTAHDGTQMAVDGSDSSAQGKNVGEYVVVYIKNDSSRQVLFSEIRLGGAAYTYVFPGAVPVYTSGTVGTYLVMDNSTDSILDQAGVAQPGETIGILFDLSDNFPIGRDTQFKLTTTNGAVFVSTVVMGQNAG